MLCFAILWGGQIQKFAFFQFLRCDDEEEGETMLVVARDHATWDWQFKYSGSEMCHNEVTRLHGDDVEEGT